MIIYKCIFYFTKQLAHGGEAIGKVNKGGAKGKYQECLTPEGLKRWKAGAVMQ